MRYKMGILNNLGIWGVVGVGYRGGGGSGGPPCLKVKTKE